MLGGVLEGVLKGVLEDVFIRQEGDLTTTLIPVPPVSSFEAEGSYRKLSSTKRKVSVRSTYDIWNDIMGHIAHMCVRGSNQTHRIWVTTKTKGQRVIQRICVRGGGGGIIIQYPFPSRIIFHGVMSEGALRGYVWGGCVTTSERVHCVGRVYYNKWESVLPSSRILAGPSWR